MHEVPVLPINRAREVLDDDCPLTNEEILALVEQLTAIAQIAIDHCVHQEEDK